MGDDNPGLATGVLLVIVGVWVVSRTLIHDAQGYNLVDRIVALAGNGQRQPKSAKNVGDLIAKGTGAQLLNPLNPVLPGVFGNPIMDAAGAPINVPKGTKAPPSLVDQVAGTIGGIP